MYVQHHKNKISSFLRTFQGLSSSHNRGLSLLLANGEVYVWGYGKGCGSKNKDILSPEKVPFRSKKVVQVSGGATHSLALTGKKAVPYSD